MPAEVIYCGAHYEATVISTGLVVQNRRTGKGVHLLQPAAAEWIDAIRTAIDSDEAHALCRAITQR